MLGAPRETSGGSAPAPYRTRLAAIARTRAGYRTSALIALGSAFVVSVMVSVVGGWFIAPVCIAIGAAVAALMWRIGEKFRPQPAELLARGRATPAIILGARPFGPSLRGRGFPDGRRAQRQVQLRIEVRPPAAQPYEVVLTTFDSPRPHGLEGRSLTVYVDPAAPRRICADWSTFDAEH